MGYAVIGKLREEPKNFYGWKGTVRFPPEPLPAVLLKKMVKARSAE